MPKKVIETNKDGLICVGGQMVYVKNSTLSKKDIEFHYKELFFNKFLNRFKFTGLHYQQINWIMRKFWEIGSVGAFIREDWDIIKDDKFYKNHPEDQIVFAPWVMNDRYNIYDYPIKCTFVNTRAVNFIPTHSFRIDEDACIGYIQRNKKGVYSSIQTLVKQIVDIEMTIRTNLKTQKMPWLIGVSPENESKMKKFVDNLNADDPELFYDIEDIKNAKSLVSGAPYTLDKLYMLLKARVNDVLTILGVNNVGTLEKKEHLVTNEVDANNEEIEASGSQYLDCMKEFFDRIKTFLGYEISVEENEEPMEEYQETFEESETEEDIPND